MTLSKGFWMGKTEVTQAQWQAVMGSNSSHFKGTNLPVESMSWNDAQEFIKKIDEVLAATDGWKTMLPTEAQWEYAARAGESWIYSGSNNLDEVAWYYANSGQTTNPVGMKKANAWGLHDMSGNVDEQCRDWYDSSSEIGAVLAGGVDPTGAPSGTFRMSRGGHWDGSYEDCRIAYRYNGGVTNLDGLHVGFRVVRISVPADNPSATTNTSNPTVDFTGFWETAKLNTGGGGWTQIWLEIEQKGDQISGIYSVGYSIGDEPQEGDDGNQNPFIGTVKGNTATIKFDPENISPGYLENVKYQDPADGKSPASATFTMSGESLIVNVTEREIVEGLRAKIAFKKTK